MGHETGTGLADLLEGEHHPQLPFAAPLAVVGERDRPRRRRSLVVPFGVVVAGIVDGAAHGRKVPSLLMHPAVEELVSAVTAALDDGEVGSPAGQERAVEAMRPAMARFLEQAGDALTETQRSGVAGAAAGHLLHEDPDGRFHVMSVVFPPGTSSGIHEHGCWGIIGYHAGLDEEAAYRRVDGGDGPDGVDLEKVSEVTHQPGEVSRLLPPAEMFHRVRNPGEVDGVSIHVLCMGAEEHPHRFWDRDARRLLPFPFRRMDGDVVRAEVVFGE